MPDGNGPTGQWPGRPGDTEGSLPSGWSYVDQHPPADNRPPRVGSSWPAVVVVLALVVVLVSAVVGLGLLAARQFSPISDDTVAGSPATTSTTPTSPPTTSFTVDPIPPTTSECLPTTAGSATPPGWQTVSAKRGLAYDVPPDWEVTSCGTLVGWEGPCADGPFGFCPIRTMSGAALLEAPGCPDNSAAISGVPGAKQTDNIFEAVQSEAGLVAAIYTSESGQVPAVTLSPTRALQIDGVAAVEMVATVTGIETSNCVGPTAVHTMVATTVEGQPGSVMFVVSLPQGGPGAVDPEIADRMVATLRPAG